MSPACKVHEYEGDFYGQRAWFKVTSCAGGEALGVISSEDSKPEGGRRGHEMQILSNPVLCILHQLGWSKHVKALYFTGYLDIQKIFTISTGAGVCPNSVVHV